MAGEDAEAFCRRFLESFVKKDFEALRSFFAPGATVASVWIEEMTAPKTSLAEEWVESAAKDVADVEWIVFDIVEASSLTFAHGTVVSLRFHSRGRLGMRTFDNDGIDTYLLIEMDGGWKIYHYSYLEKLEGMPAGE